MRIGQQFNYGFPYGIIAKNGNEKLDNKVMECPELLHIPL
jgi:hypothetical protein